MNRFRTLTDRFLAPTCMLNTLICGFFMLVQFTASSVNYDRPGMTPAGFLTCLAFSALVVATGQIFYTSLSLAAKVSAHCALSTLSFLILFVFLGSYYADRAMTVLLIALVFIILYFIIATPLLILYSKRRSKKNNSKEYTSMFYKSAK